MPVNNWQYKEVDNDKAEVSFGLNFADMDRDTHTDIIAGRYWYKNPGGNMSGTWVARDLGANRDALAVVDVDGDNRMGLIVEGALSGSSVPVIWLKPTDATATSFTATNIGSIPADIDDIRSQGYATAQVVGNHKPEIFLSTLNGIYYFQIPSNPSAGNWPRIQVTNEGREEGIAVGDIDRDGDMDVVGFLATNDATTGTTVTWWENPNDGSGSWTRHNLGSTSGIEGDRIALGDVNHDGKLDVIVTETTNFDDNANSIFWYLQPSNPSNTNWTRTTVASGLDTLNSMDAADINGDGWVDVVTGEHRGDMDVIVWVNDQDGTFTPTTVASGFESHLGARLADLDGDGDLDIVSIAFDSFGLVHLWRNDAQ